MKTLNPAEFQTLTRYAEVLSRDEHGDKVLLLPDRKVLKLFRRKRLVSSALLRPYAVRFARASSALEKRSIRASRVEQTLRIPHIERQAVVYPLVEGTTLREWCARPAESADQGMRLLAIFMARLHAAGIYFRALHLGNVIRCAEDGELELIDLSEVRVRQSPLSVSLRARNFRPLVKYDEDVRLLEAFGVQRFIHEYLNSAAMRSADAQRFLTRLAGVDRLFECVAAHRPAAANPSHA